MPYTSAVKMKNKAPKMRLKWLGAFALGVGLLGVAIIGLGLVTVWGTGWGTNLFAPGAVLVTVALSSYVAGRGLVSWQEQRQRDRESAEYRHREHVYEQLGVYILNRFQGFDVDSRTESELRIGATLWGSEALVTNLGRYQTLISRLLGGASSGSITLSPPDKAEMEGIVGDILQSMRNDLQPFTGQKPVSSEVLLSSLFNKSSSPDDAEPASTCL